MSHVYWWLPLCCHGEKPWCTRLFFLALPETNCLIVSLDNTANALKAIIPWHGISSIVDYIFEKHTVTKMQWYGICRKVRGQVRDRGRNESPGDHLWPCINSDFQIPAHFICIYMHWIETLRVHDSNGWKVDFDNWIYIPQLSTSLRITPKTQTDWHANGALIWKYRETQYREA
jgi:hypothetical protein